MKNHKMTSYQFMMLMQELPNPMYYARNGANVGFRVKVGYLKKSIDNTPTILINPNSQPMKMAEVEQVEFELVPNNTIWYWQPVEPITIITLDKKEYIKNWE